MIDQVNDVRDDVLESETPYFRSPFSRFRLQTFIEVSR